MKNNMMKKLLTMTLACAMTLSLAACGSKAEPSADQSTAAPIETDTKAYKVAIIKQLDHASLDEIANAVTAELDQISADKNVKIEYEVTSGQGDQTILKQLSDQAIADGVDAIIPIATTAAQVAAVSAEESKTPVIFAAIGINVKLDGVSGGMLAFSVLLLVISVISKLAGCGLGAKLCGFTERESIQVGVGMVCRGEVALIVANRGLSMGVLSSAMMTPVVITVVGGTILTPILLKLVFRGEPQEKLVESSLADRYEKTAQLEDASQQLLDADAAMMRKNK